MKSLLGDKEMSFVPIPGFERYLISQNGTVLDTVAEEIIVYQDDVHIDTRIKLLYKNRNNRYRAVSVARLILLAHRPIAGVDLGIVWGPKLKIPDSPITSSNLDYDFGDYIPPSPYFNDEFFPVPGFIETEINLNGFVRMSGKEVKIGNQRGYAVASARLPNGDSVTVGRHRLLALTFLKHPIHCSDLIVNHKNGKPAHDELSNLEWVTYRGNVTHAHENKLVDNHIPVEVKYFLTDEVKEFFSIGAVARHYDLNNRETKRLEFRIRTYGAIHDYRGLTIRKKNAGIEWDNVKALDRFKPNAKEVVVVNQLTGESKEFGSITDAAEYIGITQYKLRSMLRKFRIFLVGDYEVFYEAPTLLAGSSAVVDRRED